MLPMARWLTLGVAVLWAIRPASGQPDNSDASVLNLMHAYLRAYESDLSSVIADERFDQKFVAVRTRNVAMGTEALERPCQVRERGDAERTAGGDDPEQDARAVGSLRAAGKQHVEPELSDVLELALRGRVVDGNEWVIEEA